MKIQTVAQQFGGITRVSNAFQQSQSNLNRQIEKDAVAEVVDKFFQEIKAIFPAWSFSVKTKEDEITIKRNYFKAFKESNINSLEKLERGLAQARKHTSPFLPSVGQIVGWCNQPATPEDFGLPPIEKCFLKAVLSANQEWLKKNSLSPFETLLIKNVGADVLFSQPEQFTRPAFEREYEILLRRLQNGEDVMAEVQKALPPPEKSTAWMSPESKKVGGDALIKMRKNLGMAT